MNNYWLDRDDKRSAKIYIEVGYYLRGLVNSVAVDHQLNIVNVISTSDDLVQYFRSRFDPYKNYDVQLLVYTSKGLVERWKLNDSRIVATVRGLETYLAIQSPRIAGIHSKFF